MRNPNDMTPITDRRKEEDPELTCARARLASIGSIEAMLYMNPSVSPTAVNDSSPEARIALVRLLDERDARDAAGSKLLDDVTLELGS